LTPEVLSSWIPALGPELGHAVTHLYLLNEQGYIKAREILTADVAAEAVAQAEAYLRNRPTVPGVELWHGERQVKTLRQTTAA
jgi:hypothetical protein